MAAKSLTTMTEIDLVVFQIARARVERRESRWIADQFEAEAMPMEQLRWLHGRITWCICGYDSDPTELHGIASVRRFLAAWHRRSPNWLFFGSLETDNLKVMYVSLLRNASAVSDTCSGRCQVEFDRTELGRLLAHDLEVSDRISEHAGFSPAQRLTRMKAVLEYFGMKKGENW